jgi:hypothetical protein
LGAGFFAAAFLGGAFLAAGFFAAVFLAGAFFAGALVGAAAFFAGVFLAAGREAMGARLPVETTADTCAYCFTRPCRGSECPKVTLPQMVGCCSVLRRK